MKIGISAPSGYNAREILLPLREQLTADPTISQVIVITPAAPFAAELFTSFDDKFSFVANPSDVAGHEQLMREYAPDIVITPTIGLDLRDVPILRAAKQAGIATLTFVASWDNVFKMERLLAKGHAAHVAGNSGDYVVPDYLAVWNTMMHDHALRVLPGLSANAVRIIGAPRFDYFAHTERIPKKQEVLEYIGFDAAQDAPLVHGATTELYPFDYILAALASARDSGRLPKALHLYASVHPGGDMNKHQYDSLGVHTRYSFGRRETALHPSFAYLPTDEETYMLVALFIHTNVLVNQSSTVAIESMLADVPVINVAYGKHLDWWRWRRSMVYRDFKQHYQYITEENGTTLVKNEKQLVTAVQSYLDNPGEKRAERQKTIEKMVTYTDGSASKRLLAYAKEIA